MLQFKTACTIQNTAHIDITHFINFWNHVLKTILLWQQVKTRQELAHLLMFFFASKIKIISFNILISPTLLQAGLYKLIILSIYQSLRVKQFFFISSKVHVLQNMKSNYHVDEYTGGSDFHATFCIPLVNIYAQMLLHSISHGTTLYQITWCHITQNNIQVNQIFTIITFDFLNLNEGLNVYIWFCTSLLVYLRDRSVHLA